MDFATEQVGEAQRVFGYLENIGLEKSEIEKGSKSVNLCDIGPVARVAGNKKPQLITVGVSYLVELAELELFFYLLILLIYFCYFFNKVNPVLLSVLHKVNATLFYKSYFYPI